MSFVEVRRISRNYGPGFSLGDISFDLEKGETLTLMGPSGSGKTSLLRILCGLDRADSGSIAIDGEVVTGLDPVRRNVGLIFQDLALFPHMTIYENIAYGLRARKLNERTVEERISELAGLLRIKADLHRYPEKLSGGEKQRVALARSVAPDPRLLLLDEPMSSLDTQLRGEVRSEIKAFAKKTELTMVYVTHDHSEGFYMADKAGLIFGGRLGRIASAQDIFLNPENEISARFLGYNIISGRNGKVAFYPSDIEITESEGDWTGIVQSTGYEGEGFRIQARNEREEVVQVVSHGRPDYERFHQGSPLSLKILREITIP